MLFVQEQEGEREGKKMTFIKKLLYLVLCLFYLHPWGYFMKFSFWKQGMQNSERLNSLHKDYWTPYTVFITVTSIPATIRVCHPHCGRTIWAGAVSTGMLALRLRTLPHTGIRIGFESTF